MGTVLVGDVVPDRARARQAVRPLTSSSSITSAQAPDSAELKGRRFRMPGTRRSA